MQNHCKELLTLFSPNKIDKMLDTDIALPLIRAAISYDAKQIVEQAIGFVAYEKEAFKAKKDELQV